MEAHTKNVNQDHTKWAILIGVDYYSSKDLRGNLKGCVNDVVSVLNFSRDKLKVPPANTFLHAAPDPTNTKLSNTKYMPATKVSVRSSIQTVIQRAQEGDQILFHFSGHGARDKARSEYLCFTDGDMRDTEFGKLLDSMTRKGKVTAVVTLDCCFSGGATRDHRPNDDHVLVRCKPEPDDDDYDDENDFIEAPHDEDDNSDRQAFLQKGQLYRDRYYTVMTACQPHEKCMELVLGNCKRGIFTWSLISQLEKFYDKSNAHMQDLTTYEMLRGSLEATIHANCDAIGKSRQNPTLFGPQNRVLFTDTTLDDPRGFAVVTGVADSAMTLNRGRVSGVKQGDEYHLFPLSSKEHKCAKNLPAVLVVVTAEIKEYECTVEVVVDHASGTKHPRPQQTVGIGWLARLVGRSPVPALIVHDEYASSAAAVEEIRQTWSQYRSLIVSINLAFPNTIPGPDKPQFTIRVARNGDHSEVEVLDKLGKPFPLLNNISTCLADLPRRLMEVLQHLQSFSLIAELNDNAAYGPGSNLFSLQWSQADYSPRVDTTTLDDSKRRLNLQNTSGQTLYVTVFNLTPTYGVFQLFPNPTGEGSGGGKAVDNNAWMSKLGVPIVITIPPVFKDRYHQDSEFEMKDTIVVVVTTKPTDLRHYELDELNELSQLSKINEPDNVERTVKRGFNDDSLEDAWWVKKYEIVTKGLRSRE